jgi:hypothetical protein
MLRNVSHLAVALGLLLGPMAASALVIDDFTTPLTTNAEIGLGGLPNPVEDFGGGLAGGAIGGARGVSLERVAGSGTASVDVNQSVENTLSVSTGAGVAAQARIIYDGDTDGALNTTGLPGLDVTAESLLRLAVRSDQSGVVFRITFYDGVGSTFLDLVTAGGNTFDTPDPEPLIGDLTLLDQGILANVGAITLDIFGGPTAFDVSVSQFDLAVPEPGSLALMAIGLAGLRYAGSRRRQA